MQSFARVSILDSCNGTEVAVGFGVCDGAGVDVFSEFGGGVIVSPATGELGMAGAHAGSKHIIDTMQRKTLVIILKFLLLANLYR